MNLRLAVMIVMIFTPPIAIQGQNSSGNDASIQGKVTDDINGSALRGALVEVRRKTFSRKAVTEEGGGYHVTGLSEETEYEVTFSNEGYVPEVVTVTASATRDAKLTQRSASVAYWKQKSDQIIAGVNAAAGTSRHAFFLESWQAVQTSWISAEGKARVAHGLKSGLKDKSLWENVHTFNVYANADPNQLEKAEGLIWSNTDATLPVTLDPTIISDIKLSKANLEKIK